MKTIGSGEWLKIHVPTRKIEWFCLILALSSIYQLIAGNPRDAMDAIQLALLFDILDRLKEHDT